MDDWCMDFKYWILSDDDLSIFRVGDDSDQSI
jgi:hypothetical protein